MKGGHKLLGYEKKIPKKTCEVWWSMCGLEGYNKKLHKAITNVRAVKTTKLQIAGHVVQILWTTNHDGF